VNATNAISTSSWSVSLGPVSNAVVTTLAGSITSGSANGTGSAASFNFPQGIAVDSSGTVYVSDTNNHLIRKITSSGAVTTLAGSGTSGSANGTGSNASFYYPAGVDVDSSGTVYVADEYNHLIRKITSSGAVTTLAGGTQGSANGTGSAAQFNYPQDVAVDSSGTVYVADTYNQRIRKITSSGAVTTLAGSSTSGSANGTGSAAQFNYPQGIAVDSSGTVYVADTNNHLIRKITSSGAVTTLAGSGTSGSANGTGSNASFYSPTDVAVDSFGTVYVADQKNNVIRMITSSGAVTTLAGRTQGSANGIGSSAQFYSPQALDVDSSGTVYVADTFNYLIRKLQ
jgi:sugar lactone lactonase YvrE